MAAMQGTTPAVFKGLQCAPPTHPAPCARLCMCNLHKPARRACTLHNMTTEGLLHKAALQKAICSSCGCTEAVAVPAVVCCVSISPLQQLLCVLCVHNNNNCCPAHLASVA